MDPNSVCQPQSDIHPENIKYCIWTGLASVGVALIASAAKSLTCSTCKDKITMTINAVATVISFYLPVTWVFPALILAGGLTTLIVRWNVVSCLFATAYNPHCLRFLGCLAIHLNIDSLLHIPGSGCTSPVLYMYADRQDTILNTSSTQITPAERCSK